jgi:CubicO group peptidase (beta-lactamase class C family)
MNINKRNIWIAVLLAPVILIPLAVAGLYLYTSATAPLLHPDPQAVPSEMRTPPARQWTAAVDQGRQAVRAALTEQNLPGLSVAVGAGGDLAWAEGFGWADLDEGMKVTPDTRFRIGTASIVLTAAAAGLLMEQGKLTLDDEIQTYVPAFPKKPWPVTIRQLMGHVAGISNDGGDEGPLFATRCEHPSEALTAFAARPLLFEPGTAYRHSSYGWILLSAAIETAANESFLTFMRNQIFDPLGMENTRADPSTAAAGGRATSYFPRFAADPKYGYHPMRPLDYSCYAGASVFVSTPSDMVRFALAVNGGKLLRPATAQLLQTSLRLPSGEETGYGLGWDLDTATLAGEQKRLAGHDGDTLGGMISSLMTFPDGLVVAVTSNISYADTRAVGLKVAEAFAKPQAKSAKK